MNEPLRVAVVGLGIMGANHMRVLRTLPEVRLAGVVDNDPRLVEQLSSGLHSCQSYSTLSELEGLVDAAIIASPTRLHAEMAIELIKMGVHVLVEKPLASTSSEAERVIAAAEAAGVVLAVGHIERFNAAVADLHRFVDQPIHIEASRINPYSSRIADGVILDLMIHDLDIVLSIAGEADTPVSVSGVARAMRGTTEDIASVNVRFASGLTATFNTSRLGQQKIRSIEITQAESTIVADLMRQDITIHRMTHHEFVGGSGASYRQSTVLEIPFLERRGEPLVAEQQHFVDCVLTGTAPIVDGKAALRALRLAEWAAESVSEPSSGRAALVEATK